LLLWARLAGDIERLLHGWRRSTLPVPQHGAQQQMRAVPRIQHTQGAEYRLVREGRYCAVFTSWFTSKTTRVNDDELDGCLAVSNHARLVTSFI